MKNKILGLLGVLIFASVLATNISISTDPNTGEISLNSIATTALAEGETGDNGPICTWLQIGHSYNYSYIIVSCMQSAYPDQSQPLKCDCGTPDQKWTL